MTIFEVFNLLRERSVKNKGWQNFSIFGKNEELK
jgi:hypothetical protein